MDELLAQFLIEGPDLAHQATDDLLALERTPTDPGLIDSAFRAVHTLKGSVGLFDLPAMGRVLHAAEDLLAAIRSGAPADRPSLDALLAAMAQSEAWLGELTAAGALGAQAPGLAGRLTERLRACLAQEGPQASPEDQADIPDWVATLAARPGADLGRACVAVRYTPAPGAYFNGEDPLQLLQGIAGLAFLHAELREPRGADYDPFTCNLRLEALFDTPLEQVAAALRLVADQVEIRTIASQAAGTMRQAPGASQTLRVDLARVGALGDLVAELAVARNTLAQIAGRDRSPGLGEAVATVDRLTGALHGQVMSLRMTPLSPVLRRFPPLVRDLAAGLGKNIDFVLEGQETQADKSIVDGLYEPLLHILRNAVDHGIETPARRAAAGKPAEAKLKLSVRRGEDQIIIEVSDDGAGIDPGLIRQTALRRGLMKAEAIEALSDAEAINLIFLPGFSTASQVTDLSGRGVGMDSVRAAVSALGGRVTLSSQVGQGASVALVLPLALVMSQILVIGVAGEQYGARLGDVSETVMVAPAQVTAIRHGRAFLLRGRPAPLLNLAELLGLEAPAPAPDADLRVLVVRVDGEPVGVVVDQVLARMDVVLRPMEGLLAGAPAMAGSTLMGDGRVLLVMDLAELCR